MLVDIALASNIKFDKMSFTPEKSGLKEEQKTKFQALN